MESLRTAIDIQKCLETVSEHLTPMGSSDQWRLEWQMDNYGELDEDNEKAQEILDRIDEIRKSLQSPSWHEFLLPQAYKLRLGDHDGDTSISQEQLGELFSRAVDSPYGDVKSLTTVVNKEVRDAKEIEDIEVDPELIQLIKEEWSAHLHPKDVRVVPYKLNMYTSEGKFEEHLDTPDKGMVGTALISLWSGYVNEHLRLKDIHREDERPWNPSQPTCLIFYTDCPHKVLSNTSSNLLRGTLSFKIYSVEGSACEKQSTEKIQNQLQRFGDPKQKPYGFILSHGYSLETEAFKGSDALLIQALQEMSAKFTILPVVIQYNMESHHYNESEDYFSCQIYPLRNQELNYLLQKTTEKPDSPFKNVAFYVLNDKFYVWKDDRTSYAEHTGNCSQPENQNSIYLSRAVIIH